MNKNERIAQLENQIFALSMKDHWSERDFENDRLWNEELRELKG
jgi:hypothetical protein